MISVAQSGGLNRNAFLDMVAVSELTQPLIDATDDGYNVLVGATAAHPLTFPSYATHPGVLNAALNSTAAGRYQLLYRWYQPYASLLKLTDFSPLTQDLIALQQIRECRALPYIDAGNLAQAVSLCAHIWASLPGNGYGQHTNSLDMLQAAFALNGGTPA
jgi:muramidase (phage lysozyme)